MKALDGKKIRRRLSRSGLVGRLAFVQGLLPLCFHTGCVPILLGLFALGCRSVAGHFGLPNARMMSSVLYTFYSILRCETIGRHNLFQPKLFSCHILSACHQVL